MSDFTRYSLVALVLFLTHFQEGISGFGCTVLALPFITLLLGLHAAVPILVIQAWAVALFIVIESRRQIIWKEFGIIAGLMVLGMPFGVWMGRELPEEILKWVLVFFMIAVSVNELRKPLAAGASDREAGNRKWLAVGVLPLGGIIHGAFGTGGPLVVIYAARALAGKGLFRVTLALLWVFLNAVMIAHWTVTSALTTRVLAISALCLPLTLFGVYLGNIAHYRIEENLFRKVIYLILLLSGLVLIWSLVK